MKTKFFSILIVVIGLITVSSFSLLNCQQKPNHKPKAKAPNIIFYLSDDQDKLDYGCYGNDKIHTPAVDQLAREGMLFENAFTGQAICAPSRSQLYTGNYPLKNGCFLNHIKSKKDQKSISKYMRELGYEVILAGKSHVGPDSVYDWDQEWKPVEVDGAPRHFLPLNKMKDYFKNADKPFCMFITSEYPHGPHFKVTGKKSDDFKFYPFNDKNKDNPKTIKSRAGHYRNVEEDNSQLEKVLAWVDEYLDDNTIFVYSADHGTTGKFTVYDRGLNVPFIIRWPNVLKAGSRSDAMIHYTDVLPTFIDIAGGEAPEGIDGKSFLPVLKGEEEEIHEYVYGVRTNQNIQQTSVFPSRMVRSKKYKYIRNFNSIEVVEKNYGANKYVNSFLKMGADKFKDIPFEELFDIQNDPFEQVNLAADHKYREIKEGLTKELFKWMEDQGDILGEDYSIPLLKPSKHYLDRSSKFKKVPKDLENTLKKEDYLNLHY